MTDTNLPTTAQTEKPKISLNGDAFYGRVKHDDILKRLLDEIHPVNFREAIGLTEDEDLKQKHILFAVVKILMQTANDNRWNLCKMFDYVYVYNGEYWRQCSKEDVKRFLSDAAVKMGMPDYEAKHYEFAEKLLKQFLSDAHLPEPKHDERKILINLRNGTFEFTPDGWQHRDFNPDDFLTYQLPFDYDAGAACPMFDRYLLKVLPDESSRNILQEFSGFIFTKLNLEKCLVLVGSGGNGKSVFFNILSALIGKENTLQYSLGLFSHEYNRSKLVNVLLNYASEKGFDLNPDTFKALVSGEPLQAREPYGKPFTLHNKVKFIINCNELPRETESTEAYFRRFLIVPFDVKISEGEKDIALAEKIIADELPGVFNWLLAGLNRIVRQERFSYCEASERALSNFRKQADSVQLFVEENRYEKSDRKEALNDIYQKYKTFCHDDGYKPLGKNRFSQRLESKGFERTRLNDGTAAFFIQKAEHEDTPL
ncbi:MAG TPA: phage/plasmid primase, P4 family [Chitinophagales bacterium]|nr:phage/plasmid primase, P4 family [Chitinophagales bacterium]